MTNRFSLSELEEAITGADVLSVKSLPLDGIRLDGGTQPRAELDDDTIAEYAASMKAGTIFPPVIVFYDGQNYWLADGFHRWNAALVAEKETIEAEIRQGTKREAVLYSVGVNAEHGLRRTNEDKRRAVLRLLADPEWSTWTNTAIARQCKVSEGFVRKVRRELSSYNTKIEQLAEKAGDIPAEVVEEAQRLNEPERPRKVQRGDTVYEQRVSSQKRRQAATRRRETNPTAPLQPVRPEPVRYVDDPDVVQAPVHSRDIAREYRTTLVDPLDVDALAHRLREMLAAGNSTYEVIVREVRR